MSTPPVYIRRPKSPPKAPRKKKKENVNRKRVTVRDVKSRVNSSRVSAFHNYNGKLNRNLKKDDFVEEFTLNTPEIKYRRDTNRTPYFKNTLWYIQGDTTKTLFYMNRLEEYIKSRFMNYTNDSGADEVHFIHPKTRATVKFIDLYPVNAEMIRAYINLSNK
jgi:hypothetical protein